MSAHDKRKALLGFSALAAVLIVAVIALWPPAYFNKDSATGAIGAVEKHREPQITPQDVVLGDETVRTEQKIAFQDYLNDAAKLRAVSESLSARAEARPDVAAAVSQIEAITNDMNARFAAHAPQTLEVMKRMLSSAPTESISLNTRQALNQEIQAIEARLRDRQLGTGGGGGSGKVSFQDASAEILQVARQLEAAACCEARAAAEARILGNAEEAISLAVRSLQAAPQAGNRALAQAAEQFDLAARAVAARPLASVEYPEYAEYLSAVALDARKLNGIIAVLIGQKAGEDQMESRLRHAAEDLGKQADGLEARALVNMKEQFESRMAYAARLQNIQEMMGSVNRMVGQRASVAGDPSLAAFNRSVQQFSQGLDSRASDFRLRAVSDIEAQLASMNEQIGARERFAARDRLAARSAGAAAEVEARLANLDALGSHVERVSRALNTRSALYMAIQNESLGARVQKAQGAVAELEGRRLN